VLTIPEACSAIGVVASAAVVVVASAIPIASAPTCDVVSSVVCASAMTGTGLALADGVATVMGNMRPKSDSAGNEGSSK